MRIGLTINMGNYESLRIESSEWDNSYDCAMELLTEIRKLESHQAESCALAYLTPLVSDRTTYKGKSSETIIKDNTKWLKENE